MNRFKLFSLAICFSLVASACAASPPAASPTAATDTQPAPTASAPLASPTATTAPAEPTTAPTARITATAQTAPATAGPTPAGAWVRLTPDRGTPGTTVQIDGYLPGGPTQAEIKSDPALSTATVCWQNCLNGFTEQEQSVDWSAGQRGSFRTQFTVPALPWLGSNGPEPLADGDYSISLQCLGPQRNGCATIEGSPSATFHLQGSASTRCQPNQLCASLIFSPAKAAPGVQVQVTGWAPLAGLVNGQPIPYSLVLQVLNQSLFELGSVNQDASGNVTGAFKVPQQIPGQGNLQPGPYSIELQPIRLQAPGSSPLAVAATPFEITAAVTWASLKLGKPLWIEPSAGLSASSVAIDPSNEQRLAYCAPGEIKLSKDGGKKWSSVSIAGVVNALGGSPYAIGPNQPPEQSACVSVTLDATHADSFYAVFQTMSKQNGAPPVFFMGFATSDAGNVWKLVPPPANSDQEHFGRFWTDAQGTVQALYSGISIGPDQSPPVLAKQTTDGAKTWSDASLACPASGPCIRWAGAPGSIGGMGASLPQWVIVSIDGGKNWMAPGPFIELREEGPHELAALSDRIAVLLAGNGEFPVRVTQDGGQSWTTVALPPAPGVDQTGPLFPALQILPDGSLLSQSSDGKSWALLVPGAQSWCSLAGIDLPASPMLLRPAGDTLWWQDPADLKTGSIPLSKIRCSQ